ANGNPTTYPPACSWNLFAGQSLNLTLGPTGALWTTTQITTTPMHVGDICNLGIFCLAPSSNRNLLDFISETLDPQGCAHIAYARSFASNNVVNIDATTQKVSCYTPEVPYFTNNGPAEGYSGESACGGASTTGEDLGPYATQATSNPGYPATTPMLVKDHSESDIRVDPTNPQHL